MHGFAGNVIPLLRGWDSVVTLDPVLRDSTPVRELATAPVALPESCTLPVVLDRLKAIGWLERHDVSLYLSHHDGIQAGAHDLRPSLADMDAPGQL